MKIPNAYQQPKTNHFTTLFISLFFLLGVTTLFGQAPSTILPDIVNFKITYPLDPAGNDYTGVAYVDRDNPHIKSEEETNLNGYTAPMPYQDYFYVSNNEVVFKAHCAGALTSINAYPRCELRETPGGTNDLWEFADEHELNATFRVTNLPDLKKEVCMLQIKGNTSNSTSNTSEVLRLEFREGSQGLHLVVNETTTLNYIMNYVLGETIDARLYVNNGDVTVALTNVTTGDTYNLSYTSDYDWGYFKAGCYTQSSIWVEKNGVGNELPTAYGEVRFSNLTLGVICAPAVPGNRMATNIGTSDATLNWEYNANIDHYNVRYRPNGSSTWIYFTSLRLSEGDFVLSGNTVLYDIMGLLENTEYEWQVRAKCPDGSASSYNDGAGPNFTTLFVLPVELANFRGHFDELRKGNNLSWQTYSEINNSGFFIEHSLNPSDGFETIGWIDGAGDSDQLNDYSFNDQTAVLGKRYYYRLQQIDLDGKISLSKVIAIQTGSSKEDWTVSPNPVLNGVITIHAKELIQDKACQLQIVDTKGSVVFAKTHLFQKEGKTTFDLGHLPHGIYALLISNDQGEVLATKRIVFK